MNAVVVGRVMDRKVEALVIKTPDTLPHSFVLRSTEVRFDAWHIVSHCHVSVDGQFYRIAVLAAFEPSESGPVFTTRHMPVEGTLLEVLTMDEYLESRK